MIQDLVLTAIARIRLQRDDVYVLRGEVLDCDCTDFMLIVGGENITQRVANEEFRHARYGVSDLCLEIISMLCIKFEAEQTKGVIVRRYSTEEL